MLDNPGIPTSSAIPASSVIPAKAGTHAQIHLLIAISEPLQKWIPAFAGMTKGAGITEDAGMIGNARMAEDMGIAVYNCEAS